MQEQMGAAVAGAMKDIGGAGQPERTPAPATPVNGFGRKVMGAMIKARETGCQCVSAQLLRAALDEFMTDALRGFAGDDPGPDPQQD